MPDDRALLVSLKPVYAELILAGSKTVELRRVRPAVSPGCDVLLYASSPTREMVGRAKVAAVEVDSPEAIWAKHGADTGIDRMAFDTYFAGARSAVAITLRDPTRLRQRVPLPELRRRIAGFRPPQSFRYLASAEAAAVC